MTQALRSEWTLDVKNWIASAQAAGKVTQTEAERMQRTLNSVQAAVKSIGDRVGDVKSLAGAHKDAADAADRSKTAMSGITREFLVLGHELSQGQYKRFGGSLLVLAEYSTTAKNALSVLVGPLGGVAAAIGVLGLIAASGAHEQHKFNMMLIETGNAAGLTAARLEQVAAAAAKNSRATIGAGVESAMAVAGTGRFGPETFAAATEAALLFQRVTGKTAEEVVTDLAKMRDGVAQWAAEHNKSMHFMSAGQYEAVRRMEEAGHAEEAQRAVLEALNAKLSESTRNLGFFARAWDDVKASVSDVAHAIANWGKSATIDTEVARITSRLEIARSDLLRAKDSFGDGIIGRLVGNNAAAKVAELESVLAKLRETKAQNDKLATEEGKAAKRQQEGTEARKLGDDLLNQSKSHLNLQRELTIWKERFAKAAEAGAAFTKQEQEAIVTEVTRKYTPREDKKLETEFQNLIKSLADEKVKLDAEAANWTMYGRSLDNARAAVVRFRTSQGDLRGLSDPNKAKAISAAEAADAAEQAKRKAEAIAQAERLTKTLIEEAGARAKSSREEFIARELSRENLIALDKESAAMKAVADAAGRKYDAMISTPAIKKWVEQVDEEVRKINEETAAIGMGTLARKQNEAAIKLHATAQAEAEKYPERAAEIWEKYADAVRRVKDALAKQDAASKTFGAGATKAVQQYVDDAANEAKFAENLVTGTLNRAADAFVEFAKTGKLNLSSLFSFMAEEYLRQFFRMQIASMIDPKSSFASSFSLAGIWNGITSFASGFFGHATGADYVPYDGYPALLHEGERVLTKQEARQGSGNVVHFDFSGQTLNVGQGVSRGEVANALAAQRAAIMGDVRRQVATKGYVG